MLSFSFRQNHGGPPLLGTITSQTATHFNVTPLITANLGPEPKDKGFDESLGRAKLTEIPELISDERNDSLSIPVDTPKSSIYVVHGIWFLMNNLVFRAGMSGVYYIAYAVKRESPGSRSG